MGIVMLLASWAHEYMDVFVNIDGHCIEHFRIVLIIRRNVNMATSAILHCGLTSPYQDLIDCSVIIRKQCMYIATKS